MSEYVSKNEEDLKKFRIQRLQDKIHKHLHGKIRDILRKSRELEQRKHAENTDKNLGISRAKMIENLRFGKSFEVQRLEMERARNRNTRPERQLPPRVRQRMRERQRQREYVRS